VKGWYGNPYGHSLAARGIKVRLMQVGKKGINTFPIKTLIKGETVGMALRNDGGELKRTKLGSLVKHSDDPNIDIIKRGGNFFFVAKQNIPADSPVTVNHFDKDLPKELFKFRKAPIKFYTYVIKLEDKVKEDPKFIKANPKLDPKLPAYYVGQTSLNPELRLQQHKEGYLSNRYVQNNGLSLIRNDGRLYKKRDTTNQRDKAEKQESQLAKELRNKGHGVRSN